VRCAITAAGVATVDRTAPGRGAWVCSAACFELAMKRKAFERSWRRPLPPETVDTLREAFQRCTDRMNTASTGGSGAAPSTPTKG
jgi:hypothetical protein